MIIFFLSLIIGVHSACNKFEHEGICHESCTEINMFNSYSPNKCVSSCKELNLPQNVFNCESCGSKKLLTNSENKIDYCVGDCFYYSKLQVNKICIDSCKSYDLLNNFGSCISGCYSGNPILRTTDENYCVPDCIDFGLYEHNPCEENCKAIDKFLYRRQCVSSYAGTYKYFTDEENYLVDECYYHDLFFIASSRICVESCKSVGLIVQGKRGSCSSNSAGYDIMTYKNENYLVENCYLFGKVLGPSKMCVEKCKEIGKRRNGNNCVEECSSSQYPIEFNGESYCISEQVCLNIGKYPIKLNNINICSDECFGTKCNRTCEENQYYSINDYKCVNSCKSIGLFLYNNTYCIKNCPIIAPYVFRNTTENICTKKCPEEAPYLDNDSDECIRECTRFIFEEYKCYQSCTITDPYIYTVNNKRYCVKNCHEVGLYNNLDEMLCVDNCKKYFQYLAFGNCFKSCPQEAPYSYGGEDENKCVKNCSEIGLITNIVNVNCVTNCRKIGLIFKIRSNCISKCPTISKFIYSTEEEDYCVDDCSKYNQRAIVSDGNQIRCLPKTCKEQHLALFNKMCMDCPLFTLTVYGQDEIYCTINCYEFGMVPNFSTKRCIRDDSLDSCENNKFKDFLNKKCVDKCPKEIPFVQNYTCVKNCEKFFYEDIKGNKICTDDCTGKYILGNERQCVSSCEKIKNYQLGEYNICFSDCNEGSIIQRFNILTRYIFLNCVNNCKIKDNTKSENDCVLECLKPFKYKPDNNKKICYQSCKEINKYECIENGKYLCVDNCKKHNQILYENKCIKNCPLKKKFKAEKNGEYICIENCENEEFLIYNNITHEYACFSEKNSEETNNSETQIIIEYTENCNVTSFFNSECKISWKSNEHKKEFISDIINKIQDRSLESIIASIVENDESKILRNKNEIFTISSLSNQNITKNSTFVDLGICEDELKRVYNLNETEKLIIFKIETYYPEYKIPVIQYEIFSENGTINLDLNNCKNIKTNILIPVSIDENELFKYDIKDEFYHDQCHQYTTQSKTDITLYDRKKEFNDNHLSLCEINCEYQGYDINTKTVKCECEIKTIKNFLEKIDEKRLLNEFKNVKKITNLFVFKCFKLVFSKQGFKGNIGNYIMLSLIIISILYSISFYFKGYKKLITFIESIGKEKNKQKTKDELKNLKTKENIEEKKLEINVDKTNNNNSRNNCLQIENLNKQNDIVELNILTLNDNKDSEPNKKVENQDNNMKHEIVENIKKTDNNKIIKKKRRKKLKSKNEDKFNI